jgi:glycosyltransferase involved in cell wall biosynthesis
MRLVSVIIPCYNRARFIAEAIGSALAQDHRETEVIVVDDGSTDGSWDVISSFGRRVRAVRVENGGVGRARNIGIAHARGSLVKFLDSDDLLEPGVIARQVAEIASLPDRSIPLGTIRRIDERGAPLPMPRPPQAGPSRAGMLPLEAILRFEGLIVMQAAFFPADALRAIGGFREDLKLAEDHDLMVRLYRAGNRLFLTGTPSTVMRIHGGPRLSEPKDAEVYAGLLEWVMGTYAAFESETQCALSEAERIAFSRFVWSRGRIATQAGHLREARRLFAFASQIGGRKAWAGVAPIRLLYHLFDPVTCERIALGVKRLVGRAKPRPHAGVAPRAPEAG